MRKVLYISGSRADYGPARRLLLALDRDPLFDLQILVTGMHLDPRHGETWTEIYDDNLRVADRVYGRIATDTLSGMSASVGLFLYGMSSIIERLKPDIVLVLGDRGEQLAGAMAGAFQNIVVAHLCGGTLSGSIDDSIRHAISKFAHLHFPMDAESGKRIKQMGESEKTIHVFGLPGGDIRPDVTWSRKRICEHYDLDFEMPYILLIQHAVTQSKSESEKQIEETLCALVQLKIQVLLANPNDDSGSKAIEKVMVQYAKAEPQFHIVTPPRSREQFASIMANAAVLVGNSSSGVVEAMSVKTPVVNVGDRQRGREIIGRMLNADYDRYQIRAAIETALYDEEFLMRFRNFESHAIQMDTEEKIIQVLKDVDLTIATRPKAFSTSEKRC